MLTDLQIRKLTKIFQVFDLSKDKHLNLPDFDMAASRYIEAHKLSETSHKAKELHEMYLHLWEECIEKPCDLSRDSAVTLQEWLKAWNVLLNTKVGHEDIDYIGKTIYESLDIDHNKRVTYEEFEVFHKVYGIYDEKITYEIFHVLDVNHNGSLSKDEIIEAVNQFFYSDNPKVPGNFLFGKLDIL